MVGWSSALLVLLLLISSVGKGRALRPYQTVERADGLCATFVLPLPEYACREYTVETDDGFLLGVQRLWAVGKAVASKPAPVFLQHGILSGGDTWVLNPPEESLAFVLADAGYHVWIGNFRTTTFSYGHTFYPRLARGFWEWSLDELATMDLPAMLEMVYRISNNKVHYIGFSQGSQAALAALSEGGIKEMVDKVVLLAPVAYVSHVSPPLEVAAGKLQLDKFFGDVLNFYFFTTKTIVGKQFIDLVCEEANAKCFNDWITTFSGSNCCLNESRRLFYDKFETQATSTKNLQHLAQLLRTSSFRKYDCGIIGNMLKYQWPMPPPYDLSKVPTQKMMLVYGKNDGLADMDDVEQLLSELRPGFQKIFVPQFGHVDFIMGVTAKTKVYDPIMLFLQS